MSGSGEDVLVDVSVDHDRLVARPPVWQPSLEDLLAAITSENLPETGFDDAAVGQEVF